MKKMLISIFFVVFVVLSFSSISFADDIKTVKIPSLINYIQIMNINLEPCRVFDQEGIISLNQKLRKITFNLSDGLNFLFNGEEFLPDNYSSGNSTLILEFEEGDIVYIAPFAWKDSKVLLTPLDLKSDTRVSWGIFKTKNDIKEIIKKGGTIIYYDE